MSKSNFILALLLFIFLGVIVYFIAGQKLAMPPQSMSTVSAPPAVRGFYKEEEILFLHTEASDKGAAQMLTDMMSSPVIFVPKLAGISPSVLSDVFVFTNGVKGGGPMGFQSDVFSSVPSDEDYSPLRAVNLISWKSDAVARELKSLEEVRRAESNGEIIINRSNIIVNMPIIKWPDGRR